MNEKMIFLEFQKSQATTETKELGLVEATSNKLQDLQAKYDQCLDANVRRVFDFQKLRKSLMRLKSDLHVFKLSKELQGYDKNKKE